MWNAASLRARASLSPLSLRFCWTRRYVATTTAVFKLAGELVRPEVAHNLMTLIAEGAGGYVIREYQELRLAECDYARRDDGYRKLSSYTGGANDLGIPMPGTAPCLMRPCAKPKTMSFLLPHPHTPIDPAAVPLDAPAPSSDYVRLATWKGLRIASLPFSGSAVPDVVFSRRDELKAMLKRDGVRLPDDADAQLMLAQYNELFSLPWNRDNEVWLPVLG